MKKNTHWSGDRFGQVPLRAAKELTLPQLRLFVALCTYADPQGRCRPSQATLADDTGVSPRQVKRDIQALKETGWVRVTRQGSLRDRRANEYQLQLPPVSQNIGDIPVPLLDEIGVITGQIGDISDQIGDISGSDRGHPSTPQHTRTYQTQHTNKTYTKSELVNPVGVDLEADFQPALNDLDDFDQPLTDAPNGFCNHCGKPAGVVEHAPMCPEHVPAVAVSDSVPALEALKAP